MSILNNLYHYKFRVDRIIDGDTIVGKLDKGRKNFDEDVTIRFLGTQSPEISKAKTLMEKVRGIEAKEFLESLILNQWVVVKTYKIKEDDNFSRMLGDIYLPAAEGDIHINQHMIDWGHAVPYKKRKW
jgi:endonuclease YncB( thermonuclease family)